MQNSFTQMFRQGLFIGLGMFVPLLIMLFVSNVINYKLSSYFYAHESSSYSYKSKEEDRIKSIEVQSFHDVREGDFVMVLGAVKNTSKEKISNIKLEAEFFNAKGEFVYEETEYISKALAANEVENFSIKCGCTNRTFPEYSKVTVRVVSTSNY